MQNKPNSAGQLGPGGAERAKQTQFPPRRPGRRARRRNQSCETNPISGARPDSNSGLCKTKPISGGTRRDEAAAACNTGQVCKTNPIQAGRPADWVPLGANNAKRTQFGQAGGRQSRRRAKMCKTNPIWAGGAGAGATERAKRTQFVPAWAGPGLRRAKDAKRTQFPSIRWMRWVWNMSLRAQRGNPPP